MNFTDAKHYDMDDGTHILTSPVTDIKRPVCADIGVHKSVLMSTFCVTNPTTFNTRFYVRQFTTTNKNFRRMADWMKEYAVEDVCMGSTGKY